MTSYDAQCKRCGGMTWWTGTDPWMWPRCQWCGSLDVVAWCLCDDHTAPVEPAEHANGQIYWAHVSVSRRVER